MKKRNPLTLLGGVGLGAGLMYLLDPDGGRRRRALARDKAVHGLKVSGKALRRTSVDVGNRTRGLVSGAASRLRKGSADDQKLEGRVRSKLGRHLSNPSALQVQCVDGRVILSGPVLATEFDKLVAKVQKIKGVQEVESRLEIQYETNGSEHGGRRGSLKGISPRTAVLGLGGVGALAGLGLLARSKSAKSGDLNRPLRESRWGKGKQAQQSGQQLEW
jgi:hypothetical protein